MFCVIIVLVKTEKTTVSSKH